MCSQEGGHECGERVAQTHSVTSRRRITENIQNTKIGKKAREKGAERWMHWIANAIQKDKEEERQGASTPATEKGGSKNRGGVKQCVVLTLRYVLSVNRDANGFCRCCLDPILFMHLSWFEDLECFRQSREPSCPLLMVVNLCR